MKKAGWKKIILSIDIGTLFLAAVAIYATAFLGSLFSMKGVNSFWYLTVRPSITPPDWVFPIVWNIIFFLMFIALYIILKNVKDKKACAKIEFIFGLNLLFNFLWSFFYFGLRNPLLAFIDLILLWTSILLLVISCWNRKRIVSWLLLPYLLWVTFAGVLNFLSAFT